MRPRLEEEARAAGIKFSDRTSVWRLLGAVSRYHDEQRRPELERQARELGITTRWGWYRLSIPRGITSLSLAIYDERERRRLMNAAQEREAVSPTDGMAA